MSAWVLYAKSAFAQAFPSSAAARPRKSEKRMRSSMQRGHRHAQKASQAAKDQVHFRARLHKHTCASLHPNPNPNPNPNHIISIAEQRHYVRSCMNLDPRQRCSPCAAQASSIRQRRNCHNQSADDSDEFQDPITGEVIIDPVVGSDGCTYDRCCRLNTLIIVDADVVDARGRHLFAVPAGKAGHMHRPGGMTCGIISR